MEKDLESVSPGNDLNKGRIRKCACGCPPGLPLFRFPDINKPHTAARRKVWLRLLDVKETEHVLDKNNQHVRIRDKDKLYACYRHFSYRMRSNRCLFRHSVPDLNIKGTLILPAHYGPPTKITNKIINTADQIQEKLSSDEIASSKRLPVEPVAWGYKDHTTFMEIAPSQYFEGKLPTVKLPRKSSEERQMDVREIASEDEEVNSLTSSVAEETASSIENGVCTSIQIEFLRTFVSRSTSPMAIPTDNDDDATTACESASKSVNSLEELCESPVFLEEDSCQSWDDIPLDSPPHSSSQSPAHSPPHLSQPNSLPHSPPSHSSTQSPSPSPPPTLTYPSEVEKLLCHDKMPLECDDKMMMAIVGHVVQTDDYLSANTPRKQKLRQDLRELQQRLQLLEVELKVKDEELKMKDNQLAIKDQTFKIIENELQIKENALLIKEEELKIKNNENKKLINEYLDYIKNTKGTQKQVAITMINTMGNVQENGNLSLEPTEEEWL